MSSETSPLPSRVGHLTSPVLSTPGLTTLEDLEAREKRRLTQLPSLTWTDQQEVLRGMKVMLEHWLKAHEGEVIDADTLTQQLFNLSFDQTLVNLSLTVDSNVARVTTTSLECLLLLQQCVTVSTTSPITNLIRHLLCEGFMSGENIHSRQVVDLITAFIEMRNRSLNTSILTVITKKYSSGNAHLVCMLLRFTAMILTVDEGILQQTDVMYSMLEGLYVLILMDATPVTRLLKEVLKTLLQYDVTFTALRRLPASKRSTFIDFAQREKMGVEIDQLMRTCRMTSGTSSSDTSYQSEIRPSISSRLSLSRPVLNSQNTSLTGVSMVDAETDTTHEDIDEPIPLTSIKPVSSRTSVIAHPTVQPVYSRNRTLITVAQYESLANSILQGKDLDILFHRICDTLEHATVYSLVGIITILHIQNIEITIQLLLSAIQHHQYCDHSHYSTVMKSASTLIVTFIFLSHV